jgi:hypothetical protein
VRVAAEDSAIVRYAIVSESVVASCETGRRQDEGSANGVDQLRKDMVEGKLA